MKAPVVTIQGFTVVGLEYFGNNQNGEIPAMWPVFNEREEEIPNKLPLGAYGVCSDMDAQGNFSYVACVQVSEVGELPNGMVVKSVPAGKYAVFTFTEDLSKLQAFYQNIYGVWMQELGFERDNRPDYEHYDERFMKNGEFDIYIPIK